MITTRYERGYWRAIKTDGGRRWKTPLRDTRDDALRALDRRELREAQTKKKTLAKGAT